MTSIMLSTILVTGLIAPAYAADESPTNCTNNAVTQTFGSSLEAVVTTIGDVTAHRTWFPKDIDSCINGMLPVSRNELRNSTLTPREIEVLRCIAQGLSKKEIAKILNISVKTIERHTEKLMLKTDLHDRVKLARLAIREGLVEP